MVAVNAATAAAPVGAVSSAECTQPAVTSLPSAPALNTECRRTRLRGSRWVADARPCKDRRTQTLTPAASTGHAQSLRRVTLQMVMSQAL
jgi:hypothetical protein